MEKTSLKYKEIPQGPGVYFFVNTEGEILYVGKAKNLRNRIRQYFLKELGRGPAIISMVGQSKDVSWLETDSEIEALIVESEYIKKLKPRYNARLKDDKSFLVIKITKRISNQIPNQESQISAICGRLAIDFPTVELIRFKDVDFKDKTADYFGPYPSGELLKKSLRYLRKIFPFRDCSATKYKTYARRQRACIYGDIKVCTGPCAGLISPESYYKNINYLKSFLRGKKKEVIRKLEKEMAKLSRKGSYEEAAAIRDKLRGLDHLGQVAIGIRDDLFNLDHGLFKRIECYDISNLPGSKQASGGEYAVGSMVVATNGKIDKSEYKKFKIKLEADKSGAKNEGMPSSDLERLEQVLVRRFKNDWTPPNLLVIDGGESHLKIALEVLKKNELKIPVVSISKGRKRDKNDFHFSGPDVASYVMANKSFQSILITLRDESHRFAINYYRSVHRKEFLEHGKKALN